MDKIQEKLDRLNIGSGFLEQRVPLVSVTLFGAFVNLLILTGPIFALQVYDRVLGSGSIETMASLAVIMSFLFVIMGLLELARCRIAARISERFYSSLEEPIFDAMIGAQNR